MPALVLGGSVCSAALSASFVISHFDGMLGSARWGSLSHASDSVSGGGLQFMLPLRSITNNRFDGISCACTLAVAHPPFNTPAAIDCWAGAFAPDIAPIAGFAIGLVKSSSLSLA